MSYVLSKSNGSTLLVLNDGLVDNALTSITLIGKNVAGYGDAQNENFLHMLENFASPIEPRSPIQGQIWFDTNSKVFRPAVFDGANWRPLAVSVYSSSPVDALVNASGNDFAATQPGDFWFDSVNKQLYVITSTSSDRTLVGPESVSGFNTTRMVSDKMTDTVNQSHAVIKITLAGEVVGILSPDNFTPNSASAVSGFSKVNRGLTFKNYTSSTRYSTATSDVVFYGLHEQLDPSYPRRDVDEHITADWYIDQTLNFGTTAQGSIEWNNNLQLTSTGGIKLQTTASNLVYSGSDIIPSSGVNLGGSSNLFNELFVGAVSAGSPTAYGTLEGNWNIPTNSSITPAFDNQTTIGTSAKRFNSVWTRNIASGVATDLGNITGDWKLTVGSNISPTGDATQPLGQLSLRYNTVYTTAISAGTGSVIGVVGSAVVTGDVDPAVDNVYELGNNGKRWNTVNAVNVAATNVSTTKVDASTATTTFLTASTATINNVKATDVNFTRIIDQFFNAITQIDTDGALSANSNARLSTQRAVRTYVDNTATFLKSLIDAAVASLSSQLGNIKLVPTGAVFYTASPTVPADYLECNGQLVSKLVYPNLFAVIGYTYGGSGNNFCVPDLRGQFIRGVDNGRGIDPGRTIGTSQSSAMGAHQHNFTDVYAIVGDYGLGGSTASAYDRNGNYIYPSFYAGNASDGDQDNGYYGFPSRTDASGIGMSNETRPTNVALLPIIKT